MLSFKFRKLYQDVESRADAGKNNPAWLHGFLQGLGRRRLTGFQIAALVDLLLVHPEVPVSPENTLAVPEAPENSQKEEQIHKPENSVSKLFGKVTLAQR